MDIFGNGNRVVRCGQAAAFSYIRSLDGIEVRVLDLIPLILAFSRKGRRNRMAVSRI